jgi:NAD+ diphosphatase
MSPRWSTAVLDTDTSHGLAVVRCGQGFALDDNGVLFPRQWLKAQALPVLCEHGIGHFDGEAVFLLELEEPVELPGITWAREHRFCGSCGSAMTQVPRERAMYCQACDLRSYPRISPSMIVLITRGDEILLARSPRFVTGVYSTLAGFAEPGESAEDCLRREVYEEVQLKVRNIQYIGSQCWPFPHSMMLGFHAEYESGDIVPQADEIEDAQWFNVHDLPPLPAGRSIARHLIDLYVARKLGLPEPVLPGQAHGQP